MTKDNRTGVALMFGGATANQLGAATAALAFPVLGPAGVVAVRQWVAALLLAVGRPRLRSSTARRAAPGPRARGGVRDDEPLALLRDRPDRPRLAVTLEFLGPLAVALAGSRRRTDLACAIAAAAAVGILTRPRPSTDYLGVALAPVAATCWAQDLLNRTVGRRLPGVQGPRRAAGVSGLLYLPAGIVVFFHHRPTPAALGAALAAGVLPSALPFLADLLALRRVPTRFFGVFMSVNPVLAALVGEVVLHQRSTLRHGRRSPDRGGQHGGGVSGEGRELGRRTVDAGGGDGADVGPRVAVDGDPERRARTRAGDRVSCSGAWAG